ncbi:MAG: CDP-diacylglycerol--glycerol-3-phosphate 3-phosphatidyltransferase [Lentisphaerae bacterium ADurb.Bin242]|nr:MAG: CDP-diacylglycerol--glycerol-3-phosphate 3-phosphatidyltransferase [Lentisphaerae bacterium ADurb.Bin242]
MSFIKNLPNLLTISRIVMIFIFVVFANISADKINFVKIPDEVSDACHMIAFIIAVLAGLTDFLDGKIARKYKCESDFGRLMDPVADKIFIAAVFIMLADYRIIPAWIVVVVLSREFLVTGLRLLAISDGVVIAADKSGKFKTAFQMLALLIGGAGWVRLFGFNIFHPTIWVAWYCILLAVTFFTIYSGASYFVKNYKLFQNKF